MSSEGVVHIARRHIWSGVLWVISGALLAVSWLLGDAHIGRIGLAMAAVAASYTTCSSYKAYRVELRDAFRLGAETGGQRLHEVK